MIANHEWIKYITELRRRVLYCLLILTVIFLILFYFANTIYHAAALPLLKELPQGGQMIATTVTAPFFVPVRLALLLAALMTIPILLYHLWAFVTPALYPAERNLLWPILLVSTLLFYLGVMFAYFIVLPLLFSFFANTLPPQVYMMTDIGYYLNFIAKLLFSFGFSFEIPVIIWALVKGNILQIEQLIAIRAYVIVTAFIVGMLLGPPDLISQFLVAIPLWLLFELGLFFVRLTKVNK